jgi:alkylhydroperoxidase family enzyme
VQLIEPATAPPETKAAYDEIRNDWGGMLFFNLQGEKGGSLTEVKDKELVAIKTSRLNGCQYCRATAQPAMTKRSPRCERIIRTPRSRS